MTKAHDATNALREMSTEQLDEHLQQQRRKLFEVRMQQATGQVENFRQIREIRLEIARTMTVQVEADNAQTAGAAQ
jgi:large subunit ribosomal protein L29